MLIRFMVSDELRVAGYQVIEACDADEAVEILKSQVAVDLIISDVRMPGSMDGMGLHRLVRASLPDLPFILMSAHLDPRVAELDTATQFVAKPFTTEIVVAAVRVWLETAR